MPFQNNTIKKKKKGTKKKTLRKPIKLNKILRLREKTISKNKDMAKSYNKDFLNILVELISIDKAIGKKWESRAYEKAKETLLSITEDITSTEQLKDKPFIGNKILIKFEEFIKTGKVTYIEKYKKHPALVFKNIYGIGPKKIKELISQNITTLDDLRKHKELLNDTQKIGLEYFEPLQERIPRKEITIYKKKLQTIFNKIKKPTSKFEIVGSFRRGLPNSGDIDIIITDTEGDNSIFDIFLDKLQKEKIIIEFLSKGDKKSLTIGQLPGKLPRRIDFMYSPPQEYAFAILYFTGSMGFNTVMRAYANQLNFTMNEHGIYYYINKKKLDMLDIYFKDERSIFEFLSLVYKEPEERKDGRAVIIKDANYLGETKEAPQNKKKGKKKSSKKKKKPSTKKLLKLLKKNGVNELDSLAEKQLAKMLLMANDFYYNKKPILGDGVYDILKSFIEK